MFLHWICWFYCKYFIFETLTDFTKLFYQATWKIMTENSKPFCKVKLECEKSEAFTNEAQQIDDALQLKLNKIDKIIFLN